MNQLYSQYDQIPEPWRFILFLLVLTPAFYVMNSGHGYLRLAGAGYLAYLFITRVAYLRKGAE